MTQQKHLKQLVRERMKASGQRYAAARRFVLQQADNPKSPHRPGCVAGSTAFRVLLAHSGRDVSEAMAFGLAGGVGIGVFAFLYEKANFASFFVAGRHCWHDHETYLTRACERLGFSTAVKEASSPKAAEKNLREILATHGPCVAWVDLEGLPHRGLPKSQAGGGYHIITVYSIDDTNSTASIGDLTDEPIEISLVDLTAARGRIKKDKYRLLAIDKVGPAGDFNSQVKDAMKACHSGLSGADGPKNARKNFSLDALKTWADRLTSTKDPERWERVFAPGRRLWSGLTMLHQFAEYYGTGGGLCRPLMADFLTEIGEMKLAQQFAALGDAWSALADAALPDQVKEFAEAKAIYARYADLLNSGGSPEAKLDCWSKLDELKQQATNRFPLTDAECAELRARLGERVHAIHAAEVAADERLADFIEL